MLPFPDGGSVAAAGAVSSLMSAHSASGPAAGYLFQLERALLRLANGKQGDIVGVETLDDVSVVHDDGTSEFEQDKHSLAGTGHPFTDRSYALWRSLSLWSVACTKDPNLLDRAEFHLVTNRPLPPCLARRIGQAGTPEGASEVLHAMKLEGQKTADAVSDLVSSVLALPDNLLLNLLLAIRCVDASHGDQVQAPREHVAKRLFCPQGVDPSSVVDELAGWLQRVVLDAWRAGQPAWISWEAFVKQFHAILDYRKRERSRERSSRLLPEPDPEEVGKHRARTFVRQVQTVSSDDEDVDQAIRNYLQARDEKLRLSQDGDITRDDWLDFENRLVERWERVSKRIISSKAGAPDDECGREVLYAVLDHLEKLAGEPTTEHYITAGSYHQLADEPDLGWHPKWQSLFPPRK